MGFAKQPIQAHDRLQECWRNQDCGSCVRSSHGCGWCPFSSTCIPADSLLSSVSNADVCPLCSERFELRTRALGCGCSTTTLLSVIVTVFATMLGLVVLYGLGVLVWKWNGTFGTATWRGVEMEIKEDGSRREHEWRRKRVGWRRRVAATLRRPEFNPKRDQSEQEQVTERSRLLG